jgi:N-acylneuraminate cytidylyltransferase
MTTYIALHYYQLRNKTKQYFHQKQLEYKGFLIESGAFYASTVGRILDSGQLLSGVVKVVEVGPAGMIDIDEEADWGLAEHYIETGLK